MNTLIILLEHYLIIENYQCKDDKIGVLVFILITCR